MSFSLIRNFESHKVGKLLDVGVEHVAYHP